MNDVSNVKMNDVEQVTNINYVIVMSKDICATKVHTNVSLLDYSNANTRAPTFTSWC